MKASMSISEVALLFHVSTEKLREMIKRVQKGNNLKLLYTDNDRIIFKSDLEKIFNDNTGLGNPIPEDKSD